MKTAYDLMLHQLFLKLAPAKPHRARKLWRGGGCKQLGLTSMACIMAFGAWRPPVFVPKGLRKLVKCGGPAHR